MYTVFQGRRTSMLTIKLILVFVAIWTELYAKENTRDCISKCIKYNTVCRGMGYETRSCNGRQNAVIAFHALMSDDLENLAKHAVVLFGKVTLNSGSAYDGNAGIFTAPTDGVYSFTWTILTKPGSYFHTEIVINGNIVGYNNAHGLGSNSRYESSSTTAVIRMKKKDKVWIRTHKKGQFAIGNYSSFSGFQL